MKSPFIPVITLFFFTNLFSQDKKIQQNSLALELGKSGLIYNLFFDKLFNDALFGIKVGLGSNFGKYTRALMFQAGGYRLFGKKNRFFETGIDLHYLDINEESDDQFGISSFVYPNYSTNTLYITFNAGYRNIYRKTIFRIGASPGFTKKEFIPGGYISFGLRF